MSSEQSGHGDAPHASREPAPDASGAAGWPSPPAAAAVGGPVPLRPLDLGDVLDGTFRLLRADWRALLFLIAVFAIPLSVVTTWLQRDLLAGPGLLDSVLGTDLAFQTVDLDRVLLGSGVVTLLSFLLVEPILEGAVARVAASRYLGRPIGWREGAAAALRRAVPLIVWRVLVALAAVAAFVPAAVAVVGAVVAGSVLLGVLASLLFLLGLLGALLVWALFLGGLPAIVVEGTGPVTALRRSARLLRPRLWPVLGTMLLAFLVATLVSGVIGFPFGFAGQLVGGQVALALVAVSGVVSTMLSTPLTVLPQTLLYFDGRVRREGLDLQLAVDARQGR